MVIAYTLGNTKSYNEAITNNPDTKKIGKSDDYEGGWVWKTKQEAIDFLNSDHFDNVDWGDGKTRNRDNFSVYGLELNSWGNDVSLIPSSDGVHRLLFDSKLFILEDFEK
jgi:hypothetical protein